MQAGSFRTRRPPMHTSTLDILRCPYCGGGLELVTSMYHARRGDEIDCGILGCACCIFPLVAGIPVMHLLPASEAARAHVEAGRPQLAFGAMVGFGDDPRTARLAEMARSEAATFRDVVQALGPDFEGGYLLYRFTDPTYITAHAVVRAVAGTVLRGTRRAVDLCGGTGPLTRALVGLSTATPIVADLYFSKVWLARRFTIPGCDAVCCDGNAPLPFARGAFGYAMVSDAFMYIWTKRQCVGELERLVDGGAEPGAVVINHTHNQLVWSPSHGQTLTPDGYRKLFETIPVRVIADSRLFADVLRGGPLDLGTQDSPEALAAEASLTLIASRDERVFRQHPVEPAGHAGGTFQINPLYAVRQDEGQLHLTLTFPDRDYEEEFGACRLYLPEEATVDAAALRALQAGGSIDGPLADLVRRRVIVDLPHRYY